MYYTNFSLVIFFVSERTQTQHFKNPSERNIFFRMDWSLLLVTASQKQLQVQNNKIKSKNKIDNL